ncbi:MAG: glycosyltransferase family 39 protein [Elusimicrobia bacterium]|nr:glycosyltransferase family 39 protein [Elusimicrobiota bacterium]
MTASASRVRWALLSAALALRLGYAWHGHRAGYVPTAADQYETIALNLLSGSGYSIEPGIPTAQREPVYPLFIAACYAPFGRQPWLVLLLQCLMGTATCALAAGLARRLFGERVGVAALAACAIHPQLIYYSAYFFRDTVLAVLFAVLARFSADWSAEPGDPAGDAGAKLGGLAAAGLGLANSAHLPAMALGGLGLWLAAPRPSRLRRAILYGAPLLLCFGLWSARNIATFGAFVAGSTHGGEEFYQALVVPPADLGTLRQREILAADETFTAAASLHEIERNAVLTRASLRWIAAHPALYASRALAGFVKFWRPWPYARAYHHSYAGLVAASLLSDAWIIPLGLLALWVFRSRWREAPAIWAGAVGLTAVYGAVHAVIRYRLPLVAPMIVMAVAAADWLRGEYLKGRMETHGRLP